ncbi:cell cycle inhibitor Nif1 [Aspergillus eucalypticola CBS 122712]|uniref:Cell cycle inhibitor Nif1 n=1 Tax=Aspergillus eucalypticola (strain CBS 122712 / IBT 29274) TaxID=1448314 RepID=A0A317WFD6_ASPEC|nr:cell cycle inhibitor Nif1 [Aspergillus eucalypticola CBS 122712]PWY85206.1 cell cycle inhibitor Nif1 [Aspergillus eucalypticola CBS 122712]
MASRPKFDHRSPSHDVLRSGAPSPRIEHYDGEIPPALSPLDAFAAQGRLLARQLEESARRNRRMSRLPPSSVARSLSQPRPGYFRSPSSSDSSTGAKGHGGRNELSRQPTQKLSPEVEEPKFRPQSEHPRLSAISHLTSEVGDYPEEDEDTTPKKEPSVNALDLPRAESPEDAMSSHSAPEAPPEGPPRFYAVSPTGLTPGGPPPSLGVSMVAPSRTSSTDSVSRLNIPPRGLAPPGSPLSRPSSSARAVQPESSDDDYSSSNAGSTFSKPRKMSASSAVSLPYSSMSSSMTRSHPRSPSMSSETSNAGNYLQRPYNFSRPLSRSSTSLSAPGPRASPEPPVANSQGALNRGHKPSPIVVPSPSDLPINPNEDPSSAVSCYTYAKYSLPRGRAVSRDSVVFSGLQTPHFEWREPLFESPTRHSTAGPPQPARTPSPTPSLQASIHSKTRSMYESPASARHLTPEHPLPQQSPPSPEVRPSPPIPAEPEPEPEPSVAEPAPTELVPTAPAPTDPEPTEVAPTEDTPTEQREAEAPKIDHTDATSSAGSESTVRPQTARTNTTTSAVITADEHVTKGIECHERGSLNESTYHLRIAAKQNHPTGMLLYALACRHGWGMRPNQREGVRWLRKAVDSVGIELMDDSNPTIPARAKELQKAYRAQFALSIYELGVSHLNGWGIEQDKSLALRCFEIAGQWGDGDALAEAGFCYAEGIGCKKDLKKAAKFYRQAEAKGISMVGNSWIYKDKYMDEESSSNSRGRGQPGSTPEKKQRSKSRTRSLFHRKKSVATEA